MLNIEDFFLNNSDFYNSLQSRFELNNTLSDFPEKELYSIFHETGLLLGSPICLPYKREFPDNALNDKEEIFLILSESFYLCFAIKEIKAGKPFPNISEFKTAVANFYAETKPEFYKNLQSDEITENEFEKILFKRISIDDLFVQYNYTGYFYYSLLCIDILCFYYWLTLPGNYNLEEIQVFSVNLIVQAIISDSAKLNKTEALLLKNFIHTLNLQEKNENKALNLISKEYDFDKKISLSGSWLLKKTLYETGLLVVLSDSVITENENKFLEKLKFFLCLSEEDSKLSLIQIEQFVYANFNKRFSENKISNKFLKNGIIKRFRKVLEDNREKIYNEIKESKELLELLNKSSYEILSDEEKKKVRSQLFDILKTIPSLAIFLLPGGAIILPVLIKILPENYLLPSSFRKTEK